MLNVIIILIITTLGVLSNHLLEGHQGRVLIQTQTNNIEMSLTVLIVLIILGYLIFNVLYRLIVNLLSTSKLLHSWFKKRRWKRAQQILASGIQQFSMQDYPRASQLFEQYIQSSSSQALPYLLAAHSQFALQKYSNSIMLLERSRTFLTENEKLYWYFLHIHLALKQQRYNELEQLLDGLRKLTISCETLLRLMIDGYIAIQQYNTATELLLKLQKPLQLTSESYHELQLKIYRHWMSSLLNTQGAEALFDWWSKQKRLITLQPELQTLLASLYYSAHQPEYSEAVILKYNKQETNLPLLNLIATQTLSDPHKITLLLQKKLQHSPDDINFKRLLAYSLKSEEQYQEAIELLLECVAHCPNAMDYWSLAQLYQKLQQLNKEKTYRDLTLSAFLNHKTHFMPIDEREILDNDKNHD